jgi:formyltetrahydrofolate deformylase
VSHHYTLTLSCSERPGIVHAVSSFLFQHGCDIVEHQQFDDAVRGELFLRTAFVCAEDADPERLSAAFRPVAERFGMSYQLSGDQPPRVVVLVSRLGHCLNDLVFRWRAGNLGGELVAVVSNHEDLRPMAEAAGLPFFHVPVTPATRRLAEQRLLELVDEHRADLVVLARYMQVLSGEFLEGLGCPAINIHHSFLPAFAGADPYQRAWERGVKLIGATAHYVTEDLDAGPIIEQDTARVSHRDEVGDLARIGRDLERLVLARAVRAHLEDRVLVDGDRTVVF